MTKLITANSGGIEVKGHYGTWYVIDSESYHGQKLFLLEHEDYGDEVPCLIVTQTGHVKLDDVYNGWDDLDS
jgi:hypothetical protein